MTKAMRDANGTPVFVENDGSYTEEFPETDIVRRGKGLFIVYAFTGSHSEYTEYERYCDTEQEALDLATELYGNEIDGKEVFEVEVHEID